MTLLEVLSIVRALTEAELRDLEGASEGLMAIVCSWRNDPRFDELLVAAGLPRMISRPAPTETTMDRLIDLLRTNDGLTGPDIRTRLSISQEVFNTSIYRARRRGFLIEFRQIGSLSTYHLIGEVEQALNVPERRLPDDTDCP